MSSQPKSRARFDKPEPERSRFGRRSRSPSARQPEAQRTRSRSPIRTSSDSAESPHVEQKKPDPTEAKRRAAEAAAKINASILAKQKNVDGAPIRSPSGPPTVKSPADKGTAYTSEIYQQDGDYIKDIEINDLRNRYTLTKGSFQKMISDETGADVTTRGEYYPDKNMATPSVPALYLHITSTTKEGLEKAVARIDDMMQRDLPVLVDERRFRRHQPPEVERDEYGRRKWPEEKIPVDLEPINGFNLRAQVVGAGGSYVKHIQQETSCRVQIKGRGSGYVDPKTGTETDEAMYLHVAGPDPAQVQRARELCESLLARVKEDYEMFKERPQHQRNDGHGRPGYGDRGDRDRSHSYGYGGGYSGRGANGNHSDMQSPVGGPSTPGPSHDAQQQQWAQYYGTQGQGQDPYAQYGGYQNYYAMYYQYYQSQQGAAAAAPPPPLSEAAPPPPPGSIPPPPPPESPASGYHAVPPPPGM